MSTRGPDADEIRTLADESRQVLDELRRNLTEAGNERHTRLDELSGQATELVDQLANQIAGELSKDTEAQYSERAELARQELEAERETLHSERDAWLTEKTEWESVREQIEAELGEREDKLEAEKAALKEQGVADSVAADEVLLEKLEHARAQQEASEKQFTALHAHVNELTTALETANERLVSAAETEAELEALRSKFDLVMADLQTHREHVEALEKDLAQRPEAGPTDNAELAQLQEERDELARQLEDLSAQAPAAEPSEELEDLRKRFEMAVEEVRELKNENNELSEQLASAASAPVVAADGNDWEAQKQRLLASLEGEGESEDEDRQQERAKIEGTIQITDEVIAEKDREIERLLETIQASIDQDATDQADGDRAANAAVLDADESIRAERERLAKLEAEVEEKLRKAELELSVERVKSSRTQAELAEQQIELETLRAASGTAPSGESKRRWMDKLGLGNNSE